jgi:hypothetical protein
MNRKTFLVGMGAVLALVILTEVVMTFWTGHPFHLFHMMDRTREYPLVSVDELTSNPASYQGLIAVPGRVAGLNDEPSSFMLGAIRDGRRLHVRFSGSLPVIGDSVLVVGLVIIMPDSVVSLAAREVELR